MKKFNEFINNHIIEEKNESDHEVFMIQSNLDSIIKNASELKEKIGNKEINIPAWIEEYISNAKVYLTNVNDNYYSYNDKQNNIDKY